MATLPMMMIIIKSYIPSFLGDNSRNQGGLIDFHVCVKD